MKNKFLIVTTAIASCLLVGAYVINCAPAGERVVIPAGSVIELSWQPPTDTTGITAYDAYFISSTLADTTHLPIPTWNTTGDTNVVQVAQVLPLGDGFVKMTATNAGGQSVFSADSADYTVTVAPPQPPSFIRIKVVTKTSALKSHRVKSTKRILNKKVR